MASLIHNSDSPQKCISFTRRHQRLTKHSVNDNELIEQIQVPATALKEKAAVLDGKNTAREDAYDDLLLADRILDDTIRNVYDDFKKYDRDNIGERTLNKVFPDGTFGDIVRLPFAKEVTEVEEIALRIESLGELHTLYNRAAMIREKASGCSTALNNIADCIKEIKHAEADVEIAKEALIRMYEINYLEARKKYGRSMAESLFPRSQTKKMYDEVDEVEEITTE